MADFERDEYDHYDYDQDKIANAGHSGKGRTKKEVADNTRTEPGGNTRKNVQKLMNNHQKEKDTSGPKTQKTEKTEKKT